MNNKLAYDKGKRDCERFGRPHDCVGQPQSIVDRVAAVYVVDDNTSGVCEANQVVEDQVGNWCYTFDDSTVCMRC